MKTQCFSYRNFQDVILVKLQLANVILLLEFEVHRVRVELERLYARNALQGGVVLDPI